MEYFGYILLSLIVLLVMVLIHELGHYTAAKILGFTVEEFSIGFGPKIFGKRRKNGELFSVRLLPLGGFCAFLGETDDEEEEQPRKKKNKKNNEQAEVNADVAEQDKTDEKNGSGKDEDLLSYVMRAKIDEDKAAEQAAKVLKEEEKPPVRLDKHGNPALTYNQQKPWKRIIVLLGGVVFNFLSAIIFSLVYIWTVGYAAPTITAVNFDTETSSYYNSMQEGDIITAVNGENISVMNSYSDLMSGVTGDTVRFTVLRGGEVTTVDLIKKEIKFDKDGKPIDPYSGYGFMSSTTFIGATAGNAFTYCVPYTFKLSWSILGSFGQLITGKTSITSVSGPIGSIKLMADVSFADWRNILILLPLLASNLAIFNLLPFPALDGARIIFTLIEWVRGKPINRKVEGMINFIGLAVLLLFVLIVDILSFAL